MDTTEVTVTKEKKPKKIAKAKIGRPSSYRPEMLPIVLELSKQGKSVVEICAHLGITRETFYSWSDPEDERYKPAFCDTALRAKELCEAWWVQKGQEMMQDRQSNANIYALHMMNRFGWNKKTDNKTEHSGSVSLAALTEEASKE